MNTTAKSFLILVAIAFAVAVTAWVMGPWFEPVSLRSQCRLPSYEVLQKAAADAQAFQQCLDQTAKLFLEKDYAEVKDLAKTFLTLLSAVLVASITFSEKIVDIHSAKKTPLLAMLACWLLLMLAIVFTGSGLASMAIAAGLAAYHPITNFLPLEAHSVSLFLLACVGFGAALLALIVAGAISLSDKRAAALSHAQSATHKQTTPKADDDGLSGEQG